MHIVCLDSISLQKFYTFSSYSNFPSLCLSSEDNSKPPPCFKTWMRYLTQWKKMFIGKESTYTRNSNNFLASIYFSHEYFVLISHFSKIVFIRLLKILFNLAKNSSTCITASINICFFEVSNPTKFYIESLNALLNKEQKQVFNSAFWKRWSKNTSYLLYFCSCLYIQSY